MHVVESSAETGVEPGARPPHAPVLRSNSRSASRRGPSMADVAQLAGVSAQTVSRVSNGRLNVDDQTREKVTAAMRQLDYRPNGAARALKRGSFNSIGVIIFTLSTVGNLRTLDAVSVAASDAGFSVTLIPVAHPTAADVSLAFSRLSGDAVDGIIVIVESQLLRATDFDIPLGIPVVVMDSTQHDDVPVMHSDQGLGARQATEHLLGLGHRTVWHIAGPANSISSIGRERAWRHALIDGGADVPTVEYGDWTADSGYRHGCMLAQIEGLTAVFAANDQMALGVMRAMHEAGRAVPAEVSVVGFDDIEEAANFWPPLTTIHQDFTEVGRRAVTLLISLIRQEPVAPRTESVRTSLVVRQSSGPPPAPVTSVRRIPVGSE